MTALLGSCKLGFWGLDATLVVGAPSGVSKAIAVPDFNDADSIRVFEIWDPNQLGFSEDVGGP